MMSEEKRSMALSLAVEEQREDGSGALRDTMISTALDEGNSVADVAEALGLTAQAVYKAQGQRQSEPRGPQGAGADERAVVVALEAMTDAVAFERLVNALIGEVELQRYRWGAPEIAAATPQTRLQSDFHDQP